MTRDDPTERFIVTSARATAIGYIDGFNFHHGTVRHDPSLKWLNFEALCDELLRGCRVIEVNYYTAKVRDGPKDPGQSQRQNAYIQALEAQPRTRVVYGQFQRKKVTIDVAAGTSVMLEDGSTAILAAQRIRGRVFEEKGSAPM